MLKKFLAYLQSNTKKHTKLQHRGKYFVEAFTGKRKFYLFLLPYRKVCQQATATMCWKYAAYPSRALHRVYTECSFLHRLQRNPPHTCQRIPPIQHNPNQTRSYSVHGYSTFSKKSLKFNKFVYVKVKAWIMQPLDFSRGSYFKGEALQSNIDPSICNSNPDSRLSLWKKKNSRRDCTLYKKLLPPGMSPPVTGNLFTDTANVSTTVHPSPFEQEILS